jgi:hypothetical protein
VSDELAVVQKKVISLLGNMNRMDSEIKKTILANMHSPKLQHESTMLHVRYGVILALDIIESQMREQKK